MLNMLEWSKDILFRRSAVEKSGISKGLVGTPKKQFVREYRVADGFRVIA